MAGGYGLIPTAPAAVVRDADRTRVLDYLEIPFDEQWKMTIWPKSQVQTFVIEKIRQRASSAARVLADRFRWDYERAYRQAVEGLREELRV
jgi:hypothetical protein